jgi:hypothetical protein
MVSSGSKAFIYPSSTPAKCWGKQIPLHPQSCLRLDPRPAATTQDKDGYLNPRACRQKDTRLLCCPAVRVAPDHQPEHKPLPAGRDPPPKSDHFRLRSCCCKMLKSLKALSLHRTRTRRRCGLIWNTCSHRLITLSCFRVQNVEG